MKFPGLFIYAALTFTACNQAAPVQWEYKQVNWGNDFASVELTIDRATTDPKEHDFYKSSDELADAMGKHHWELVSVTAGPGGEVFYFKRPRVQVAESYIFEPHFKQSAEAAK